MQLTAWMLILTIAKVILGMGVVVLSDPLGTFMSWLFAPLEGSPRFKLVLVMVLLPCALNTLQFWVRTRRHLRGCRATWRSPCGHPALRFRSKTTSS